MPRYAQFYIVGFYYIEELDTIVKDEEKEMLMVRLNIIGHWGAGKTSLRHRLTGDHDPVTSTDGISVYPVRFPLYGDKKSGDWDHSEHNEANLVEEFQRFVIKKRQEEQKQEEMERNEDVQELDEPPRKKRKLEDKYAKSNRKSPKDDNAPSTSSQSDPEVEKNDEAEVLSDFKRKITERPFEGNPEENFLKLNIWDFGGQDDFIATHHLFLDVESTNVIVMDMSKDLDEELKKETKQGQLIKETKPGHPNTPGKFLHYWLNFIYFQSKRKGVQPNVALVLTHLDRIKEGRKEEKITKILDEIKGQDKSTPYSDLITRDNTYVISNTEGSKVDFEKLKQQLLTHLTKQDSFTKKVPARWLALQAEILSKATNEEKQHLHYSNVKELAKKNEIDEEDLMKFLKTYHSLGAFLYYPDPESDDGNIVITDPQWLPDVCKTLITTHDFLDERMEAGKMEESIVKNLKKGVVTRIQIKELWSDDDQVNLIVRVLKKFDLIARLDLVGKEFVIPCMLPPSFDEPEGIPNDFVKIEEIHGRPQLEQGEGPNLGIIPCQLSHMLNNSKELSKTTVQDLHYDRASLTTSDNMKVTLSQDGERHVTIYKIYVNEENKDTEKKKKMLEDLLPCIIILNGKFLMFSIHRFESVNSTKIMI